MLHASLRLCPHPDYTSGQKAAAATGSTVPHQAPVASGSMYAEDDDDSGDSVLDSDDDGASAPISITRPDTSLIKYVVEK